MYDGTVTSKFKPIVTMLTEALVKDFTPAYKLVPEVSRVAGRPMWFRTDEDGQQVLVSEEQLWKDVESWLLNLEDEMDNDSDRAFAKMTVQMIRKNKGWVNILTKRLVKRLSAGE